MKRNESLIEHLDMLLKDIHPDIESSKSTNSVKFNKKSSNFSKTNKVAILRY